ncbi:inhibitor of Bruton tyrosine kinase-like [Littorina saxatilis]|uniref:BTB domain-containing protein n=1 Tax=Littorina saxatilis TaxID=31220 RepID=A0AAN9GHR4_9CAEN
MPVTFQPECGPKCRSKLHNLEVNSVVTKGSLLDLQAYSRLCHTWAQHNDTAGRSALHVAASCGKLDMVEWLVTERHQDPSQKDKESGWTALHRALFYGQLATARLLVQCNNDLYCRDHEGLGPLDLLVKDRPKHISFGVKDQNEVFSWGDNSNLTLGHASEQRRTVPEAVDTLRRLGVSVKQIVMCKYHTVFLTHGGQVYTCGHGQGGRLGHGDELAHVTPRLVETLQNEECVQVAAARDHTLFLTDKNTVYGCGLNDCGQLGLVTTGDKGTNKSLVPTKMNLKLLKGKPILGVFAGRFHSVVCTADGLYTCGLNAGQIGHPKGEQYQSQLRMVTYLQHKDIVITKVASSDAAIVCFTARGDIFLLHEYTCRKIGARWLDIEKLCLCGGNLDHNSDLDVLREKGGFEVKVVMLNSAGKVFMWRSGSPSLKRCHFAIRRQVTVTDIAVNTAGLLLVTDQGEAFTGYPSGKKLAHISKDAGKDNNKEAEFGKISLIDLMLKDEVEEISLRRLPAIHRASGLACDVKGRNFAIMQALPNGWLTDVPTVSESLIHTEYQQLMEEADLYDAIHDCVVQVGEHRWPAHMFILASRADYFRKQVPCLATEPDLSDEKPVIDVTDVEPDVMEQLLKFIYTDTCDFLTVGSKVHLTHPQKQGVRNGTSHTEDADNILFEGKSVSAYEVHQHGKKGKNGKEEKRDEKGGGGRQRGKDPVKVLQEAARRFGVKGLSKRLEAVKCVSGVIQSSGKKLQSPHIKYERTKLGELYDVCIRADDSTTIQCHKCVLAARLEYFHSMLGSGWIETSDTQSLSLPIPGDILEILLDFVYQDESSVVAETQDLELVCNVLVVADQLLVERLKEMCEVALTSQMTLRNVGELLEIATAYNASQLRLACQQFITLNLPVLLESRSLDMVGDDTMQELTDYYKSSVDRMSSRIITPWSHGPDSDFLAALTAEFEAEPSSKPRDSTSKKTKSRRRQTRTKSASEDTPPAGGGSKPSASTLMAERRISISSDISAKSEEDTETEDVSVQSRHEMPSSPSKGVAIQKPGKSRRWLSFNLSSPLQCDTKTRETTQGGQPLPSPVSPSGQSPVSPTAASGISLRNIMEEEEKSTQSAKPKGCGKFSWKELKKQQNKAAQAQKSANHDTSHAPVSPSSPPVASPPVCPWGSMNKVVQSFRDLMLQERTTEPIPVVKATPPRQALLATSPPSQSAAAVKHSVASMGKSPPTPVSKNPAQSATSFSWGLPARTPSQPQAIPSTPTEPPAASSPPENPWQRLAATSPPVGAGASVCFSAIVEDQEHQKRSLEKASQKPLHLIQMEEEAIAQLLKHYHAHERFDEFITVERVSGPMAAPLWNRKRTTSSSHT